MTDTLEVVDALIVVPKFDNLVHTSGDEVFALVVDGEGVKLSSVRAIEQTDSLAVVAIPVADFAVRASSEQLGLIGVIDNLLEHG